jgi:hypothetical protein
MSQLLAALEAHLNALPETVAFPAMIVGALGLVAVTYAFQLACIKPAAPAAPAAAASQKKD